MDKMLWESEFPFLSELAHHGMDDALPHTFSELSERAIIRAISS
jgi:hypothetical protein